MITMDDMTNSDSNRGTQPPRLIVRTILLLASVIVIYTGLWYALSEYAKGLIVDWVAAQTRLSIKPDHTGMRRSGFPFAVRWSVANPRLETRWAFGTIRARGESITYEFSLLSPLTLRFRITDPGVAVDGHPDELILRAERLDGNVSADGSDGVTVAYRLDDIAAAGVGAARSATGSVSLSTESGQPERLLMLALDGVTTPYGERISLTGAGQFEITARLRGDIGSTDGADLVGWRDAGGAIELETLRAAWPPTTATLTGTLALDNKMRPLLVGAARLRGESKLVDGLVAAGSLKRSRASTAKSILALLARPAADGGPPVLSLPLTIRGGNVRLGPLVVGSVGSIVR